MKVSSLRNSLLECGGNTKNAQLSSLYYRDVLCLRDPTIPPENRFVNEIAKSPFRKSHSMPLSRSALSVSRTIASIPGAKGAGYPYSQ